MIIKELEGFEFNLETRNCYTLLRDFYRINYDIHLSDVVSPGRWWDEGLDLYRELALQEGFSPLHCHPSEYRTGDVVLMAIGASVGNHIAIILPDGKILHHLINQRSSITSYGGLFRNTTVAVYRHRDVIGRHPGTQLVQFEGLLTPHVRRRLEKLRALQETKAPAG